MTGALYHATDFEAVDAHSSSDSYWPVMTFGCSALWMVERNRMNSRVLVKRQKKHGFDNVRSQ